ncbi:MAG: PAQR family membrane homeostasis protein TrhA, partial [Spirochaetaceae bacterium]
PGLAVPQRTSRCVAVLLLSRSVMADRLPEQLAPSEIRYHSGGAIEEIFNSLTHAMGAGLAIAGLVALLIITGEDPSPWKYIGFSIYGATQIMLYLSSALMHSFAALPRVRYYLRIVDQAFIYLLIAGTYTPVTLIAIRGAWGWTIFGIVWALATAGILLKTLVFREPHVATDLLYIPMGWLIVVAARPLMQVVPVSFVVWALAGGLAYTVGVAFYAWQRLPFNHTIWHFFVLAGSICFYVAFTMHLA